MHFKQLKIPKPETELKGKHIEMGARKPKNAKR
jgi:hypothetical protein